LAENGHINITFPDGSIKEFPKGITSMDIASSISKGLAEDVLVAEVNGKLVDLVKPISEDAAVKFYKFDDDDGRKVYWHTTSHIMAQAIEELFPGAKFGVGPPIENGFYYDVDSEHRFTDEDLKKIEDKMLEIAKRGLKTVREELKRQDAIEYFKKSRIDPYKVEILEDIAKNEDVVSLYHQGGFTDLCRGPHMPTTAKLKNVKLLHVSGSYWRGDSDRQQLQRIYGISFPKKKDLDNYLHFLEEAEKRDHRKLGKQLDLYSTHEEAGAGLVYWHPNGAMIRMQLEDFWRKAHLEGGYELLYTPHMGKSWLWETSGHLGFYKDSMYAPMIVDEQQYYMKPMNCPFHIMIYKTHLRSYKDLPLRWAELGTVYRYEKSGVLHGLLRVRGFTQDDAHIFCTHEQIESEIIEVLRFARSIFTALGFETMNYYLATKPEDSVGDVALWKKAEDSLVNALKNEGLSYEVDEGGGAFYGPKIDIKIKDALGREWQLSTIQFDFNMPQRFDMKYIGEDGKEHQPFMVHRALLGSMERFFGILIEHYAGAFPLWLAPVQAAIIPITDNQLDYAKELKAEFKKAGIRIELDDRREKMGYKIRDWETKKVPYMIVIGDKEKESGGITVRAHKKGDLGSFKLSDFIKSMLTEIETKSTNL
jgi:threonyl-tRNA synthetase